MSAFDEIKERQRHMWTVGDFAKIATRTVPAAEKIVDRLAVERGERVLDVATGTGNAALIAAQRGAVTSGLDLTPKLLAIAAERASDAGVEIDLVEGDAEALPYEDDSFDAVVSMFGVMFAPDQQRAAGELVRVCRPGGRIGIAAWTPEGGIGQLFMLLVQYLPPPPEGFQPPILWGNEDHVRGLFAASGASVTCTRERVHIERASVEEQLAEDEQWLGPVILAKEALEPEGRWEEARAKIAELTAAQNQATDGSLVLEPEYLQSVVELPE
ncbi:MAG TPA: methyltransferase domain-containing protein [Solirubrobacterales bacterium]|nr:methyltransferase domain-containing protein [Solirubrobacterales bacterium]